MYLLSGHRTPLAGAVKMSRPSLMHAAKTTMKPSFMVAP